MLDMLGENARAAVGKVKSLQSQGATPEQVDMQLMEAARNGLLPISIAFAVQKALQRQNPTPPPPQGTVVGDMMQQLTAAQAPAMPPSPRQQGVAALPNPVMDNSQFAGGGIVAFAPGGSASRFVDEFGDEWERAADGSVRRVAGTPVDAATKGGRIRRGLGAAKDFLTKERSAKETLATGLRGASTAMKHSVVPGMLLGGVEAASEQSDVPIEYLRWWQDHGGDMSGYYEQLDKLDKGDHVYKNEGSGLGDVARRVRAGFDKGLDTLSFGIAGLDPYKQYNEEMAARAAAAVNQPPPAAPAPVAIPGLENYKDPLLGQLNGLAGLAQGPDMKGYRNRMEQYLAQSQEGVPTEVPSMGDAVDARRKLNEKYGVYKPIEASEARIAERRAKAEKEGGKSVLTELGLAFLTKGVIAAGEGKNTLSAMAYAIDDGAKNYKERKERTDAILDKLDDAQTAVDNQKAAIASGEISAADADVKSAEAKIHDAKNQALTIRMGMLTTELQMADSAANRKLQTSLQILQTKATLEEKDQLGRYTRRWEDLKSKGPKFKAQADAAKAELVDFITSTSLPFMEAQLRNQTLLEVQKMKNNPPLPGKGGQAASSDDEWGEPSVQ
jgi:hypothetical protein